MSNRPDPPLTPSERRRACGIANCDERTFLRWERGLPVRSTSSERIERAVAEVRPRGGAKNVAA